MTANTRRPGRFAEPSLYILVSLSDGPKHGYLIMQDVEAMSAGPSGPGPSTAPWRGSSAAASSRASRPTIAAGPTG